MTTHEPGAVIARTGRSYVLVVLAATGFVLVGVLAALWTSVGGGFTVDGVGTGGLWTVMGWVVLVPLALVLGVAVLMLGRALLHPTTVAVSPRGYRRESRGRVEVEIATTDLTGVLFRPAGRATWQASDPADPSHRGVGHARLGNRIELRAPHATVDVVESGRWREVVDVVRRWVEERPELVDDETTRSFLLGAAAPPTDVAGEGVARKPHWPWGMLRLAISSRDPWAPFLPDAYGQYSPLFSHRYAVVRAPQRGGRVGLFLRWLFLVLWVVPILVVLALVVRLLLLLV